jgi:DNA polymerase III epsilon subunit-like protein
MDLATPPKRLRIIPALPPAPPVRGARLGGSPADPGSLDLRARVVISTGGVGLSGSSGSGVPPLSSSRLRCAGITVKGTQCRITTSSGLRTDLGSLVCQPLQAGGSFCVFHGGRRPEDDEEGVQDPLVLPLKRVILDAFSLPSFAWRIVFYDLETVRLVVDPEDQVWRGPGKAPLGPLVDYRKERVVEIGAICATTGAVFQQLVWPGGEFPEPNISGLTNAEVHRSHGGGFPQVFARFEEFLWSRPGPNSSCRRGPRGPRAAPLLLVAHNGNRFDAQVLYRECVRHGGGPLPVLGKLYFCDSLEVAQVLGSARLHPEGRDGDWWGHHHLGCKKLQCLARELGVFHADPGETGSSTTATADIPHRALFDARMLEAAMRSMLFRCGLPGIEVLGQFAWRPHLPCSGPLVSSES